MGIKLFSTNNSTTNCNFLHHEHDFIMPQLLEYENVLRSTRCITCETCYCILCGKMLNNEQECSYDTID